MAQDDERRAGRTDDPLEIRELPARETLTTILNLILRLAS